MNYESNFCFERFRHALELVWPCTVLGSGKDLALMLSDPSSFALRMVCVITGQIESRSLSVFKSEQVWLGFCFLSFFFFKIFPVAWMCQSICVEGRNKWGIRVSLEKVLAQHPYVHNLIQIRKGVPQCKQISEHFFLKLKLFNHSLEVWGIG